MDKETLDKANRLISEINLIGDQIEIISESTNIKSITIEYESTIGSNEKVRLELNKDGYENKLLVIESFIKEQVESYLSYIKKLFNDL